MPKTKMRIERYPVPQFGDGRWDVIGLANLNSDYMMPVLRDRRNCNKEAKSKYIPHQGRQECIRRLKKSTQLSLSS